MTPSDDVLIVQYLAGNMGAFERLYGRYASRLLGFLTAMGVRADGAEDVAQRTWL